MENGIIRFALILICIGTMITSIMSVLTFFRQDTVIKKQDKVIKAVKDVHEATNGMHDALIKSEKLLSFSEGVAEEKQREADSH